MQNGLIPNSGEMCVSYTTVTLFFFALELESKFNWCEGDGEGERRVPPGLHSLEGSLITRIKSGSGGRRRERWGRWMEGGRNFGSTVWIVQKDNMGGGGWHEDSDSESESILAITPRIPLFIGWSVRPSRFYSIWHILSLLDGCIWDLGGVCIWSSILTTVTFSTITTQPPTHRPSMSTSIDQLITSSPHPPPNRSRAHKYKLSVGWESILVCQSHISGVSSFTRKVLS